MIPGIYRIDADNYGRVVLLVLDLCLSCPWPTTSLLFIDMILDPTLNPALAAGDPGSTFDATSIFYSVSVLTRYSIEGMLTHMRLIVLELMCIEVNSKFFSSIFADQNFSRHF